MKVRQYQASEENTILTALITNDNVLGKMFRSLGSAKGLLRSKWSCQIAQWCFDYFEKYKKAPGRYIEKLFAEYSESEPDAEAVSLVEKFLTALSSNYESSTDINEQWTMDMAARYFERVRLEQVAQKIESALDGKDIAAARTAHANFKPIEFSPDEWKDPFAQEQAERTFDRLEGTTSLIQFPGDLGKFLSPHFSRGDFISFLGPEKRGKSFWLMECGWQALRQRRRVLYYVFGDMSEEQWLTRFYCRALLRPRKSRTVNWPTLIKPGGVDEDGVARAKLEVNPRKLKGIEMSGVFQMRRTILTQTATSEIRLKLKCMGASRMSASMIENDMLNYVTQMGTAPDVVIIDYADLLAAEAFTSRQEPRHQINETWKILRRISLEYHCLVLTATQASARAYDKRVVRKGDFSEDKRKAGHITGMIGINQTSDEHEQDIYRLNWIFLRDGSWGDGKFLWTAGCRAVGAPALKSAL